MPATNWVFRDPCPLPQPGARSPGDRSCHSRDVTKGTSDNTLCAHVPSGGRNALVFSNGRRSECPARSNGKDKRRGGRSEPTRPSRQDDSRPRPKWFSAQSPLSPHPQPSGGGAGGCACLFTLSYETEVEAPRDGGTKACAEASCRGACSGVLCATLPRVCPEGSPEASPTLARERLAVKRVGP